MPATPPETPQTATQTPTEPKEKPDLTSVRTLITSVSKLARHLNVTNSAVYRWIYVNRIPGGHVVAIANYYDVELRDLIPLTGSDTNNKVETKIKPRGALKNLLEVYRGNMPLKDACEASGITEISGKLVLTNWGDELPTLYTTLEQLSEGRIDIEEAMIRLNVSKYTLHGIRRKYGYAPGRRQPKPRAPLKGLTEDMKREIAYQVIAGKVTAAGASEKFGKSYATMIRYAEQYGDISLRDLKRWPSSFREALATEVLAGTERIVGRWYDYATTARLILKRQPKYPHIPKSLKRANMKRLLIAVLVGEATLDEIAEARGGDPTMIAQLFTGELRPLKLTYDRVSNLSLKHQIALAELLMAMLDRKRKFVAADVPVAAQVETHAVGDVDAQGELFEGAEGDSEGNENV